MTLGDEPRAIAPDNDDPTDLIVGTLRLPAWVGRVPRAAWLFVVLAAVDGAWRIAHELQFTDVSLTSIASLAPLVVTGVAVVLLPAAVLLGGRATGRVDPALVQGAIALAAAELVRLTGPSIVQTVIGFQNADAESVVLQALPIEVPAILLSGFGLLRIGLALAPLAGPDRPFRRAIFAIGSVTVALTLVAGRLMLDGVAGSDPFVLYDILVLAANIGIIGLWSWLAATAIRRDDRSWRLIAIGSLAIVLANAIGPAGYLVGSAQAFVYDVDEIFAWVSFATGTVFAVGSVLLIVGFGSGVERASGDAFLLTR